MEEQAYYLQPQQSQSQSQAQSSQQQSQQQQQQSTQQPTNQTSLQKQSQQQQGNTNINNNISSTLPASYSQGVNNYQTGGAHQMTHLLFNSQSHPAYLPVGSQHIIDYSQLPSQQTPPHNYPSAPPHYAQQIHHGYTQQPDQYLSQQYQQPFDYDHSNQINQLSYYAQPTGITLGTDQSTQGNGIQTGLQAQQPYGQYPPTLSSQQHYSLDPIAVSSAASYGQQYQPHPHQVPHPGTGFASVNPTLDQANNYLQFGQPSGYPGASGPAYLPFNGQIHTHTPYGLISNANQIGLIDPSIQGRQQQQQIGKASIKSEEQAMENEINLLNSLGDSQSQAEDKLKQQSPQFMIPQTYDQQQQQPYQYYALGPQHFQGYPGYPSQGQILPPIQQVNPQQQQQQQQQPISPLHAPGSANSIKDNKDDKRQPNSPGRKKAIKKGSPPTEPSSPASPRGRKRKNTGKNGEIEGIQSSNNPALTLIQQSSQPVQSQPPGNQFGLHLMKVPSQPDPFNTKTLGYVGVMQSNYGQLGSQGNLMLDTGMQSQQQQQISSIDQTSLQRLKELPADFNLNDFAGVNDEQKQIGTISKEERKQKIKNYQEKRKRRTWEKKISYDVRKKVADSRLRDKGRFVTKKQAMEMLSLTGREEEFTMDQLKEMLKLRGIGTTGGDEDSKSPTLHSKNSLNGQQPRRLGSLKQGEEYDGEDFEIGVRSEEQLPNDDMLVINKMKSCEGLILTSGRNFNANSNNNLPQNQQFFQEMMNTNKELKDIKQNRDGMNSESNNSNLAGTCENNLILKLEQKEVDNKGFKQQVTQQQMQQQQQQQQYQQQVQQQQQQQQIQQSQVYRQFSSSPSQSQSPSRSPRKQQNCGQKLIELLPTQQPSTMSSSLNNQSEGSKSNILPDMTNNNNNFNIETTESPSSLNNILSQDVADQFNNLNIKSPDQKHQKLMQNNPQMLSLAEQNGQNLFFGVQQGQQNQQQQQNNYILHNGQPFNVANSNSNNSSGYPIHQQQE